MSGFHDDGFEMSRRRPIDDATVEDVVTGRARDPELAGLNGFVDDLRMSAFGAAPEPSPELAAVLTRGFSTDQGDQPATAARNANGPAVIPQAAGLPKCQPSWRNVKMKISRTLAGLPIVAKIVLGVTVAAAATTGAGAAGMLPGPIESVFTSSATSNDLSYTPTSS